MVKFGDLLRSERKKAGKTLSHVADAVGCKIAYLSDVERGRRNAFQTSQILKVAAALECDSGPLIVAAANERGGVTIKSDNPRIAEVAAGLARSVDRIGDSAWEEIAQILEKYRKE